jgi:hypothetical protein
MKYFSLITKTNLIARSMLILAIFSLSLGAGSAYAATETPAAPGSCGQMLANAEARFLSTLASDGSVPANEETRAAAQEYIRVSKLCYEEIEAQNPAGALQGEIPTFIDDGGVLIGSESSAEFNLDGRKWGSSTPGTSGGIVTYSFMGNGLNLSAEPNSSGIGSSVAMSSLPGFQACFITDIQNAFAAWQAVASIQFVQVNDSGSAFNASGATGDIRIGAHTFDGPSGVLAHAYYPPPNGTSAAGDMHFDRQENWTCNTSGIDIGVVALHEIGHSLGLNHEDATSAAMNPYYNPGLAGLQSDDINGAAAIYGGPVALSAPPSNDDFASAKTIDNTPYSDSLDTTGAANVGDGPQGQISCEGKTINKGTKNVWYKYTPSTTRNVSFDTFGSTPAPGSDTYDTYIAVWAGPNINSLTFVGCNDDTANSFQSQLVLRLTGGTLYYIEIAQYNGDTVNNTVPATGGTLNFRAIATGGADTTGVFRPSNGVIFLKNTNASGFADIAINYGLAGDYPVVGDWDGNGTATIGVYRNGRFLLRNSNTVGFAEINFLFGSPGDQPIAGDWDGDGDDTIGVYRPSTGAFYLRNSNSIGAPDYAFFLGNVGDVGIAGDWDGDGDDTTGVFRPSNGVIFLKNTNATGFADVALNYGLPGDKPVVGDWDDDGDVTIGVFRSGQFLLRNSNSNGFAEIVFNLGFSTDMPIAGNWNGIP